MPVLDAGSWLSDERILRLLAYSIYNPTPERVRERVQSYIQRGNQARAYMLNDEVLGIVVFALYDARAEIVSIATDPAHRRHGIARRLIYGIAAEYPVREIYAETDDDAVGFYSRCGFEVRPNRTIGEVQRYACVLALPGKCYCGHDCAHCNVYLATIRDDVELRKRARKFYRKLLGRDLPLEEIYCLGGRSSKAFAPCMECPFAACCRTHGYESCGECRHQCSTYIDYQKQYVNKVNVSGV